MIQIKSKLRRWGNSFGIIIPQKSLESENFKEGSELTIIIKSKENNLKNAFGALKNWKISSQKIKDQIRQEER